LNLHARVGATRPRGRPGLVVLVAALFATGCSGDTTGTVEMSGDRDAVNRQLIAPGKSEGAGAVGKPRKKKEDAFEGKVKGPGSKSL